MCYISNLTKLRFNIMEQGQINEVLNHQKDFLSSIENAVDCKLNNKQMSAKELKDQILSGLRWGVFLRKGAKAVNGLRTTMFSCKDDSELTPLVRVNFHELISLQNEMETYGFYKCPIFSQKIDNKFLDREIQVNFSYDTQELSIREIRSVFARTDTAKILKAFELKLTLPDAEDVFGVTDESLLSDDKIEILDAYDVWKWEIEKENNIFLQIGGNGSWIQRSHGNDYIAQVNNEVGDGGFVYVTISPSGEFKSVVEMY